MHDAIVFLSFITPHNADCLLKIIGKEFQKNCYKTIFRKINTEEIFLQLTLITNKHYFSRKKLICENLLSRYMWFISVVVTSLIGANIVNGCKYC